MFLIERQKIIEKFGKENNKYPDRITNNHITEVKIFFEFKNQNKITILKLRHI